MNYNEKFKSKKQKWLEISLALAVVVVLFVLLIMNGMNQPIKTNINGTQTTGAVNEENSFNLWKYISIVLIIFIGYLFGIGKDKIPLKTDEQLINCIADKVYVNNGIYLKTEHTNVRVERGAVGENYVEFINEHITYLYLDGVGIVERYLGETIKNIKKNKQNDDIQMKLAEIGISQKQHLDKLESLGLTQELNNE